MNYQEFKQAILHALRTKLGSSYQIITQDVIKNNDTHLDGLSILSEQCNISPTFYLNYYYERYQCGSSLSELCEDILLQHKTHAPNTSIDISFFTDYEKIKENIVFKLINYERNKDLLQNVPHFRYLDFAIVFNCLVNSGANGYGTILIQHKHLALWNLTADELLALAKKNTPALLQSELQSMTQVLLELFVEDKSVTCDELNSAVPMFVLTNNARIHGAACILYDNLLNEIGTMLDSDYYIIPSSIHEVLIIPTGRNTSLAELSKMVKEVNSTQLLNEEILSDHVYFYSRKTQSITM